MNSSRILQKICPFILLVLQGVHSDDVISFFVCPNSPSDLDSVKATVYLNGENMSKGAKNSSFFTFATICPAADFLPDVVSLTLKIGADMKCDPNNTCTCKSSWEQTDCTVAFKNACLSHIAGQAKLLKMLCCQTDPKKTVEQCLIETKVDINKIKECINNKTGQQTAIENSMEMAAYSPAPPSDFSEPYILFGNPPVYDMCLDFMATRFWPNTVCAMLKPEVSSKLETCKKL